MRLTTKGRYAVTAMLDLALHQSEGPVSLADVSRRQEISLSYLEQLFARLRRGGLVASVRGPGGGYRLGRASADIHVAQIIDAVNEIHDPMSPGPAPVAVQQEALTQALWDELSHQIHDFLSAITLAELVRRGDVQRISRRQDDRDTRLRAGGDISVTALA